MYFQEKNGPPAKTAGVTFYCHKHYIFLRYIITLPKKKKKLGVLRSSALAGIISIGSTYCCPGLNSWQRICYTCTSFFVNYRNFIKISHCWLVLQRNVYFKKSRRPSIKRLEITCKCYVNPTTDIDSFNVDRTRITRKHYVLLLLQDHNRISAVILPVTHLPF